MGCQRLEYVQQSMRNVSRHTFNVWEQPTSCSSYGLLRLASALPGELLTHFRTLVRVQALLHAFESEKFDPKFMRNPKFCIAWASVH